MGEVTTKMKETWVLMGTVDFFFIPSILKKSRCFVGAFGRCWKGPKLHNVTVAMV